MTRVDPDEGELVARCNRGEAGAFDEIDRRHRGWLLALARRLARSEADARDLVQEVLLDLWRRFPGFTLSSSLRAFLYPVLRHRAIDLGRKRSRTVEVAEIADAPVPWEPPDTDLGRLVARLPEAQREVVLLRFSLDFRLEEIAEAQGVPLGTVKSRLHHAMRALRQAWGDGSPRR